MKKTKHPLNTWAFLGIYLAILAVFAGVYALTKAINKPVPIVGTGSYTPGTYTGVGAGRNGDITVAVTVNENTIQAIQIVHHDETPASVTGPSQTFLPPSLPPRAWAWTPSPALPCPARAL